METKTMTTTGQIPESVRTIFRPDSGTDKYASLFSSPTRHLLAVDCQKSMQAVQSLVTTATASMHVNLPYRFVLEAQLDAIGDVVESLEERHPERFRDTERVRDLLENLDILLNGADVT